MGLCQGTENTLISAKEILRGSPAFHRWTLCETVPADLLLVVLDFHWFKVFGFEDLATIQTFDVIHAISAGDDLGTVMVTSGQHKTQRFR